MSSWLEISSCRKCLGCLSVKMLMASSSAPPSSRFIRSITICEMRSWLTLGIITFSSTCENGPWPTSCSSMAARSPSRSLGSRRTPFASSAATAWRVRWYAPNECWKRVCCAPGYTMPSTPNWRMRVRRWKSGCFTSVVISPPSMGVKPCTGSIMYFIGGVRGRLFLEAVQCLGHLSCKGLCLFARCLGVVFGGVGKDNPA